MPFEHTASKPEDAPTTVWLPSFRIRNLGAGQNESLAEMCPQNGARVAEWQESGVPVSLGAQFNAAGKKSGIL